VQWERAVKVYRKQLGEIYGYVGERYLIFPHYTGTIVLHLTLLISELEGPTTIPVVTKAGI
jgi:hypothetical protein